MLVYLVGFMAAGKTTVGRKLAKMLGVPFIDLDAVIEEAAQMTIPEIFANEGEAGFRKRERLALLAKPDKGVIATGGGVVTVPENRCFLKKQPVVYLQADLSVLRKRIAQTPGTRPLADHKLEERFLQREPLYREVSDLVVDTSGKTADEVAREVYQWMLR